MQWHLKAWSELTRDEVYALIAAREQVFVVEQECSYLDADGADPDALHLWAERDARVVAYLRIFAPGVKGPEARLGRVLTAKAERGHGLGREVVRRGIEVVRDRFRGAAIRIGAQKYLERFYGELGFTTAGAEYLEDRIPHVEMVRPPSESGAG